ncbi:MAG: signal peptidase I [Cyanobacteria bacterium KgW148]|nr:signal peptidase I [Cyanobacteria bacterium KgW148]
MTETTKIQTNRSVKAIAEETIHTVGMALLLFFGVHTFVAENRYIPSSSMEPTLQIKDRLIIEKISYYFRKPERGEIIVFHPPDHPAIPNKGSVYIKRVIGLPGDSISIQNGTVYVNGTAINEPYIQSPPAYTLPTTDPALCPDGCFQPERVENVKGLPSFVVPPNSYWVMGDNRNNSLDSHVWGFVPSTNVVGRAFFRYWSPNRIGTLSTPQY